MYRRLFAAPARWLLCQPAPPTGEAPVDAAAKEGEALVTTAMSGHVGKTLPEAVASLPFRAQMVELKRACRGIAQRPSSLNDAKTILNRAIPTDPAALATWLNEENASAALNGASFFEIPIPSQSNILKWTKDNIGNFKEPFNTASSALSILHLEERSDASREFLLQHVVPVLRAKLPTLVRDGFHTTVKLFQQLGVEDAALWDEVCVEINKREEEIAKREANAIRLFSCVARHAPDNAVTRELFGFLSSRVTYFKSYDFTTFLSASERWGKLTLEEALPILQRQGERTHANNARDLGVCFPAAVRIARALEAKTLAPADRLRLAQHLHFVFDACENHVSRCMNRASVDHYWEKPGDIIMALYAYESSQRHAPQLYALFASYCNDHAAHMTGREVAMALGIQRRADVLTPEFVQLVLPTIQRVVGAEKAITIEEASHIALSLGAVKVTSGADALQAALQAIKLYCKTHWAVADKADADVVFGGMPTSKANAAANLSCVFTDAEFSAVPLKDVAVRQLVDLRRHSAQPKGVARVDQELEARIKSKTVSDAELAMIALSATKPNDALRRPAQVAITDMLAQPEWGPYHLDLLAASIKLDKSMYLNQAVQLGRQLAVSPQQLVLATRKLIPIFSSEVPEVRSLVTEASEQLLRSSFTSSLQLYLVTRATTYQMTDDWVKRFVTMSCARFARRADFASLTTVMEAVQRHNLYATNDDVKKALGQIAEAQIGKGDAESLSTLKAFVASLEAIDPALVTAALKAEVVRVAALPPRPRPLPASAKSNDAGAPPTTKAKKDAKPAQSTAKPAAVVVEAKSVPAPPPASKTADKDKKGSTKEKKSSKSDEDAKPSKAAAAKGKDKAAPTKAKKK